MFLYNDITKIGIATIVSLIGDIRPHKIIRYINGNDGYNEELCPKTECSVAKIIKEDKKTTEEQKNLLIKSFCSRCPYSNVEIPSYENEANMLKIEKVLYSSRSQILHLLFLHAICDGNGMINSISDENISKELGISTKTVQNNHKYFIENRLICKSVSFKDDLYGVYIINYKDYFKTKKDYGTGYIQIDKEILDQIFKIKKVNDLRFAMRLLIFNSKANPYYDDSINEFTVKYEKIDKFLPKYLSRLEKDNLIKESSFKVFNNKKTDTGYIFKIKENFDRFKIREQKKDRYEIKIVEHIFSKGRRIMGCDPYLITDIDNYTKDFVQMAEQYSLDLVLYAIDSLLVYVMKTNYKDNYGGYVRHIIVDYINEFNAG